MSTYTVTALTPALVPSLDNLFHRASSPCHCRYWHFEGTKNDWLARCAMAERENADEQAALVLAGAPEAGGLVALAADDPGVVVGWMKLSPRPKKLRTLSVYRALPLDESSGVLAIGCFIVDPAHRGRGVVSALLAAAPAYARALGAHTIEAYPRKADHRLADEEAWMGPLHAFEAADFTSAYAEAFGPYPVLRLRVTV
ncbi:hypothetical protein BH09MYX1_BH09MYX1_66420 [soil metagenome]